jgi:hypothetical protein
MRSILRDTLVFVMLCGLAGCGDDPEPEDTGNTQSNDSDDAGKGNDTSDGTEDEVTTDDPDRSDSQGSDSTSDLPDPVLEDKPPQTPLSDLNEDELARVCAAYLDTATSITNNLDGICPVQAVVTASQASADSDDVIQEACVEAEATCVAQVASSKTALEQASCAEAEECGATIADFNACNRQVAALNQMVIVPVGDLDAPACESVTVGQASSFSVSGGLQVLIWMQQASTAGGGSPTDENGPCQRLQEQCPELGSVLDAFSNLQLPSL